jgi:exodeoxyribonuclease VII small subunit
MARSSKLSPSAAAKEAAKLSYRQAQAALELCLAELQGSDLEVEAMAELHRRAQSYADRCEAILQQAEQEVMRWDPEDPDHPPHPLES